MPTCSISTPDGEVGFVQGPNDHSILQAALASGVAFPYECSSGGCGSCRFTPVAGEFEVLWEEAPGLTRRDRRKGVQLACQTRALTDAQIDFRPDESCRPRIPPVRTVVRLSSRRPITRDITEYRLEAVDPGDRSGVRFLPGQYSVLENPSGVRRCYSMSNIADDAGVWEFQIKEVPGGEFTGWISTAGEGAELILEGPYGMAFLRPEAERDILCVAGGSGLSPMVSIVRGVAREAALSERRVHLFHGGRTPADLCPPEEIADTGLGERLRYTAVVSDVDSPQSGGWLGATGFVHEAVLETLGEEIRDMEIYFAGPPPMTEAMQRALMIDLKVPFAQIHFDRFF